MRKSERECVLQQRERAKRERKREGGREREEKERERERERHTHTYTHIQTHTHAQRHSCPSNVPLLMGGGHSYLHEKFDSHDGEEVFVVQNACFFLQRGGGGDCSGFEHVCVSV